MKIKIFYPPAGIRYNPIPPLSITTLTEALSKAGHNVEQEDLELKCWIHNHNNPVDKIDMLHITDINKICNLIFTGEICSNNNARRFLNILDIEGYDLVGFAIMGADQMAPSLLIANEIKKRNPEVKIILGGCYASNFAKKILELYKDIDYIIIGDAWISLIQLADTIKDSIALKDVSSLVYRDGNEIKTNKLLNHNIETMPILSLKGLPIDQYIYRLNNVYQNSFNSLVIQYFVSSGCVNKCSFCRRPDVGGFHIKSPKKVVEELKYLSNIYQTQYFKLKTNEINPNEEYLNELCDEIERQKLKIFWHAYARLEKLSKNTLIRMYKSGCRMLRFGVETGSEKLLKKVNKGYEMDEMNRILKDSSEAGIWNAICLLSGLPNETEDDVNQTISFIKKNHKYINAAAINLFFLLRGTDIYLYPKEYGIQIINKDSQDIAFNEVDGLSWKDKKAFVIESVKRIQRTLLEHNIGLSAVCTDLMFTTLIQQGSREKANQWLKNMHPYLFECLPHHVMRWKIYHRDEVPPDEYNNWYYERRMGGTIL